MSPLEMLQILFLLQPLYPHFIHRINPLSSNDAHYNVTEADLSSVYCTFV